MFLRKRQRDKRTEGQAEWGTETEDASCLRSHRCAHVPCMPSVTTHARGTTRQG